LYPFPIFNLLLEPKPTAHQCAPGTPATGSRRAILKAM
jgi:hypothetical protein